MNQQHRKSSLHEDTYIICSNNNVKDNTHYYSRRDIKNTIYDKKLERKKFHAIQELLQSERDYVKDLSHLVEVLYIVSYIYNIIDEFTLYYRYVSMLYIGSSGYQQLTNHLLLAIPKKYSTFTKILLFTLIPLYQNTITTGRSLHIHS